MPICRERLMNPKGPKNDEEIRAFNMHNGRRDVDRILLQG